MGEAGKGFAVVATVKASQQSIIIPAIPIQMDKEIVQY